MDRGLRNRRPGHAIGDNLHSVGSSQGATSSRMCFLDGSVLMPSTKCEAYTFLVGSIGSLSITLWFLPVL